MPKRERWISRCAFRASDHRLPGYICSRMFQKTDLRSGQNLFELYLIVEQRRQRSRREQRTPTMTNTSQFKIVPHGYMARGESLEMEVPASEFERLAQCVVKIDSGVFVSLRFVRSENNLCRALGQVQTTVWLGCHLCQQALPLTVRARLNMYLLRHESQLSRLTRKQDPFIMEADEIRLAEIVEDDLIMALPPEVRHDHCQAKYLLADATGRFGEEG